MDIFSLSLIDRGSTLNDRVKGPMETKNNYDLGEVINNTNNVAWGSPITKKNIEGPSHTSLVGC